MSEISEFTKIIRPNTLRPLSGAEPLTVIEFSLTNGVRDKIKEALEPFVKKHVKDGTNLAGVFSNPEMFPKPIIDELRSMTKASEKGATAFVIRNLPEMDACQIPIKLRPTHLKNDLQRWLKDNSYSNYIGEGIAGAAKLPQAEYEFVTARHASDPIINGDGIHKHGFPFGTINVITTDGAPTRLVDMRTLLERVEKNNELGRIAIEVAPGNAALRQENPVQMPLWSLKYGDHALPPVGPDIAFKPIPEHTALFEEIAAEHFSDVVGQMGDMVIWPDNGLVFHQAIAKNSIVDQDELLRAITVRSLGKQTTTPSR